MERAAPSLARAATALVVAVVVAACGQGTSRPPAAAPAPAPRAPSFVPPGLDTAAALTLPLDSVPRRAVRLYGSPGAASPFAEADLAEYRFATRPEDRDDDPSDDAGRPVDVAGRKGRLLEPSPGSDLRALSWLGADGTGHQLLSRHLDQARLLAVAAAVERSPDRPLATADLPGGMALLAQQDDASVPTTSSAPVPLGAAGHVVSFTTPDAFPGDQRALVVGAHRGGGDALLMLRWYFAGARSTAVGGHDALLVTLPGGSSACAAAGPAGPQPCPPDTTADLPALVLAWLDGDVVVVVSSVGVAEHEVRRAAESVAVVGDGTWADLQAAAAARRRGRP